jgi:hypothetical protein
MKRRVRELYTVIAVDHNGTEQREIGRRRNLSYNAAWDLISRHAETALKRYGGKISYGIGGAESGDFPRKYRVAVMCYQVR